MQMSLESKASLPANIKPITRLAIATSCGGHRWRQLLQLLATMTRKTQSAAGVSGGDPFNYGSSPEALESDLTLMFQLQAQTHLLDTACGAEKHWRDKVIIHAADSSPDSPGGRFQENRLRQLFKDTAIANLSTEEVEDIFPAPVAPDPPSRSGSRRPSRSTSRKASKDKNMDG
ncbi:unnamed protein product [Effrenium voratum]|nr:unnamed protein product [Effrenium voratum]